MVEQKAGYVLFLSIYSGIIHSYWKTPASPDLPDTLQHLLFLLMIQSGILLILESLPSSKSWTPLPFLIWKNFKTVVSVVVLSEIFARVCVPSPLLSLDHSISFLSPCCHGAHSLQSLLQICWVQLVISSYELPVHFPEALMMLVNSFAYLSIYSTVICTYLLLAWRIPRTEEAGGLQSMGSQDDTTWSDTTWWLNHHHHRQVLG